MNIRNVLNQSITGSMDVSLIELIILQWLIDEAITRTSEAGHIEALKLYVFLANGIVDTCKNW